MSTFELSFNKLQNSTSSNGSSVANVVDDTAETFVPHGPSSMSKIQLGAYTASDVVKHLEKLYGHDLRAKTVWVPDKDVVRIVINTDPPIDIACQRPKEETVYDLTDSGYFHTDLVRHPSIKYRLHDHVFVKFNTKFTTAPTVITALTEHEADRSATTRISVFPTNVHPHIFSLNIRSYLSTKLYSAACLWFAIPVGHPLFQADQLDFSHGGTEALRQHAVTFKHPYEVPPAVIVWLRRLDINNERIMTFATDITRTGFTLHMNSWKDAVLWVSGASWFAYPADTPGIRSGTVLTEPGGTGVVTFEKPLNKTPRRVLVGLNKIETDKKGFCRFKVIHEAVSEAGMGVRIEGWGDTVIHSAGAAYLAIE